MKNGNDKWKMPASCVNNTFFELHNTRFDVLLREAVWLWSIWKRERSLPEDEAPA
jgi:hypothetical protein